MLGRVLLTNFVQCDHRQARAALLRLTLALAQRDLAKFRDQFLRFNAALGAQLRYEEEAFFPALLPVLSEDSIEQFLKDHDEVIGCMESLAQIAGGDAIDETAVHSGAGTICRVMENVCASDRLSMLIRDLSEESAKSVIENRAHAVTDDFDSMTWAQWLRHRAGRTTGASS